MASFQIGDWVEITPTPDKNWNRWSSDHDEFCGAIGYIADQNTLTSEVKVVVDFMEDKWVPGTFKYWLWFLDSHIIPSTQDKAKSRQALRKVGSELQKWEATKKRKTDEALKHFFIPKTEEPEDSEKIEKTVPEQLELEPLSSESEEETQEWEDKTDPIIPLPGKDFFDKLEEELEEYLDDLDLFPDSP